MLHFERWKIIAIAMVCLAGIVFAMPNLFSKQTVEGWPSWMPHRQLALGLDLRGGAHLLLAMDTKELDKDWLITLRDDARKQLREAKVGFTGLGIVSNAVQVHIAKPEDMDKAYDALKKLVEPLGNAILGSSGNNIEVEKVGADTITLRPTEQGLQQRVANAAAASVETVRRRVDSLGNIEPNIVRQGQDRILVQVPGFDDTRKLKDLIGQTAKLTFHAVHPTTTAEEAKNTRTPLGYKIYPADESDRGAGSYLLQEAPVVSGEDLVDAQPGFDSRTNEPIITFRFNQSGARKFGRFTKGQRRLAVRHRARQQGACRRPSFASPFWAAQARSPATSPSSRPTTWRSSCARARCRPSSPSSRSAPSGRRSAPTPSTRARWRA